MKKINTYIFSGAIAGLLAGLIDCALLAYHSQMFFDTTEQLRAMSYTLSLTIFAGSAFGFILGLISLIPSTKKGLLIKSIILFIPVLFLLYALTKGQKAQGIPFRIPLIFFLSALASGATVLSLTKIDYIIKEKSISEHFLNLPILFLILIFTMADLFIFVRLYPAFHAALTILSLFFFTILILQNYEAKMQQKSRLLGSISIIISLILISYFFIRSGKDQNALYGIKDKTLHSKEVFVLSEILLSATYEDIEVGSNIPDFIFSQSKNHSDLSLPNTSVFLLTIDAMRADRFEPGKTDEAAFSPRMNKMAMDSVVFTQAYTAAPHTAYAISSLMTGKYTMALFDIPEASIDQETWAEIMRNFRYRTAAFFSRAVFFIDQAKFKPLQDKVLGFGYQKMSTSPAAPAINSGVITFLENIKETGSPVFIWAHYFEPHEPYSKECTKFGTSDEQRYNCEVYTADKYLGKLVDYIDENYPDSIIIVTADHGEEFRDHGGLYHGTTLYDEQIRVPLLIRIPGVRHRIVDKPVSLVDLPGTILRILDIPVPPRMRSNNLIPLILGEDTKQKHAAFAQLKTQTMVVYQNHKLIWDRRSNISRLYDLENDPKETKSVLQGKPQLANKMKQLIISWQASHAKAELRPIETKDGVAKWPAAIIKGLGGDQSVSEELLSLVSSNEATLVKQKAAKIFWDLNLEGVDFEFPSHKTDPITKCWLLLVQSKTDPQSAIPQLAKNQSKLEELSSCFIISTLTRLENKDLSAAKDGIKIMLSPAVEDKYRNEAILLLGKNNHQPAAAPMVELLNNYRLRMNAALALAELNYKTALPVLKENLEKERFEDRIEIMTTSIEKLSN